MWHNRSIEEITQELNTDIDTGLSLDEVKLRLEQYGENTLPRGKKARWWQLLFRQFINPLVFLLLLAAVMTYFIAEYLDTGFILVAVFVNVAIGFWQEFRSSRIFEKLQALIKVEAMVRRDGKLFSVSAQEIVPGDIIILRTGMKVSADARILSSKQLKANEALLTGESLPVNKSPGDVEEGAPLAERASMVYAGTVISGGSAEAVVVAIAAQTELGKIAQLTASVEEESTPLQERLAHLSNILAIVVVVSGVIIVVTGLFEGRELVEMFKLAVAVAVAAIPEGLPAALSAVLAVSSQRILKIKGLVKTLIGAETLGSTTVICTDKTGTLTEGRMKLEKLHGVKDKKRASLILALANEAVIVEEKGVEGEGTDKAKLEFFIEQGGNIDDALNEFSRKTLLPFHPLEKYIASFHERNDERLLFVTGAPEKLLELSSQTVDKQQEILNEVEQLASDGFRVIGIAQRIFDAKTELEYDDAASLRQEIKNLEFIGLALIRDPIRKDVKESIRITKNAGIRVIMITGDHKLTASAIGEELGFSIDEGAVIAGSDIEKMSVEELSDIINDIEIIYRASPRNKMQVIEALKKKDHVVAMTGDGINDAPAIKAADIGISLGSGTDVTKEAADLVLIDDSFSIITEAIKAGRTAFNNIRKVVIFLLVNSFTELILIFTALIFRTAYFPITAFQILWTNFVEDVLPNFALAFEPDEEGIMDRKPFRRKEPLLDKLGKQLVFVVGIVSDMLVVVLFLYMYFLTSLPKEYVQTIMFSVVGVDSLIYIFSIKSLDKSVFHSRAFNNKWLLAGVVIGFIFMGLAIYHPFLNNLLGTTPLGFVAMLVVFATGIARLLFVEGVKWWMRVHRKEEAIASV